MLLMIQRYVELFFVRKYVSTIQRPSRAMLQVFEQALERDSQELTDQEEQMLWQMRYIHIVDHFTIYIQRICKESTGHVVATTRRGSMEQSRTRRTGVCVSFNFSYLFI